MLATLVSCNSTDITSIKITATKGEIEVGKTLQLTVTVNGNSEINEKDKEVKWKSNNIEVASVNQNGLITGKKAGKTTIKATSKLDENKTATIEVTVFEKVIDKVKIEPEFSNIQVGKSIQLTTTITGNNLEPNDKQINWSSSDSTVASVDQAGLVRAQSQGNATITATSELDDSKTAIAEVTVFEKEVVFVTIELATGKIKVGKTIQLSARVEGNNLETTDKEAWWQSSDILVASIDQSGLITGKKPGTTTITATSKLNSSKKTTVKITVTGS